MALNSGKQHRDLRVLLDKVANVHRKDVKKIVSGHLNENKLWNPEASIRVPWETTTKPLPKLKKSSIGKPGRKNHNNEEVDVETRGMTETMVNFMLGTGGSIPKLRISEQLLNSRSTSSDGASFLDEDRKLPADNVLTQELSIPEIMLPITKGKHQGQDAPHHYKFVAMHHTYPTKKDQYRSQLRLQSEVIGKQGKEFPTSIEANTLPQIEQDLKRKLRFLQRKHREWNQPSFYRLQAFDDCWSQLIGISSATIAKELLVIKNNYDNYIACLMDTQSSNADLFQQLNDLTARGENVSGEIKSEQEKLTILEGLGRDLVKENARLKEEVRQLEIDLLTRKETVQERKTNSVAERRRDKEYDLEDRVSFLHTEIRKYYDEIKSIVEERKDLVPKIVCQRLEQGSKEMEIAIQKLCKQNQYLEECIEKTEEELEELLEESDSSEKERRRLWKRINTSRLAEAADS